MNANASRSLAGQNLDDNPGFAPIETWMKLNRPVLAAMTEFNGRLLEQMSRANDEWFGFVNRRLNEDIAASKRFMDCKSMPELFSAYSDFIQRAQQQYQAEFQYFARLNQKIADETSSALKSQIAEIETEIRH